MYTSKLIWTKRNTEFFLYLVINRQKRSMFARMETGHRLSTRRQDEKNNPWYRVYYFNKALPDLPSIAFLTTRNNLRESFIWEKLVQAKQTAVTLTYGHKMTELDLATLDDKLYIWNALRVLQWQIRWKNEMKPYSNISECRVKLHAAIALNESQPTQLRMRTMPPFSANWGNPRTRNKDWHHNIWRLAIQSPWPSRAYCLGGLSEHFRSCE